MDVIRISAAGLADHIDLVTGNASYTAFAGARMIPSAGEGETIRQEILVNVEGGVSNIADALQALGQALERAAEDGGRLDDPVYLEARVNTTEEYWRSPIYGGWFELPEGADMRQSGHQGIKIILTRANWWEQVTEATLVNNVVVTNHRDAGHTNIVTAGSGSSSHTMPGVPRVVATLTGTHTEPGVLWVGERCGDDGPLDLFYEAEQGLRGDGVTGTLTADSNSSGGNYYKLDWSGSTEKELWSCTIDASVVTLAGGRPFRPVLRLADSLSAAASEKLWARWETGYIDRLAGGDWRSLGSSPGSYLETGKELLLGPVLYLPPWRVGAANADLDLALYVSAAGTGAHTVKLDYVDFMPLDGWRHYDPTLGYGGVAVNDSGRQGMTGAVDGPLTHAMEGPGYIIRPGKTHQFQFYFAEETSTELSAGANLQATVSVFYRGRKRTL